MSTAAETRRYTPEEYLALERKAPFKSEFYRGEIFAMSGASREHSLVAGNFYRVLGNQLLDRPCEAHIADMRVRVLPTGLYTYPDVVAVCGEPRFEDDQVDTLLNPSLIVEVLSPSTEDYDRGKKFDHCRRIESLREYVLVSQDRVRVERFTRQGEDWVLTIIEQRKATLGLASVGVDIPLRVIYARVEVPDAEDGPPGEPDRAGQPGICSGPLKSRPTPLYCPLPCPSPDGPGDNLIPVGHRALRTKGGSSSGVERHVANVVVVGSNPISRSIFICIPGWRLTLERVGCVVAARPSQPADV